MFNVLHLIKEKMAVFGFLAGLLSVKNFKDGLAVLKREPEQAIVFKVEVEDVFLGNALL